MARASDLSLPLLLNGDAADYGVVDEPALNDPGREDADEKRTSLRKERLVSLDIVRGLTVIIMILVNNGPSSEPFEHWGHATWDGMGLADVVMPFFLVMVGMSVVLSFADVWATPPRAVRRGPLVGKILARTIRLFLLGLLIQGLRSPLLPFPYVDLVHLRVMGVLQRIAVVYLVTAVLYVFVPPLPPPAAPAHSGIGQALQLLVRYLPLWLLGVAFAVLYNSLTFALFVPDRYINFPPPNPPCRWDFCIVSCNVTGDLTPKCNAADYIDSIILGANHMFNNNIPHEPEGFASTVSAMGSAFAGVYFGLVLLHFSSWKARLAQWATASALLIGAGVLIAETTEVAINKNLYSVSYVLLTAGMVGATLAFVYLTRDVVVARPIQWLYFPFVCVGMNAIVIYVGDSLFWRVTNFVYYEDPAQTLGNELRGAVYGLFPPEDPAGYGQITWAFIDASLWTLVAVALWWRGIFFKV